MAAQWVPIAPSQQAECSFDSQVNTFGHEDVSTNHTQLSEAGNAGKATTTNDVASAGHQAVIEIALEELQQLSAAVTDTEKNSIVARRKQLLQLLGVTRHSMMQKALQIVDESKIIKFTSESGRSFHRVHGSLRLSPTYIVFSNFCSCHYFSEEVLRRDSDFTCKHVLAVRLYEALKQQHDPLSAVSSSPPAIMTLSDMEFSNELESVFTECGLAQ